MTLLEQAKNRQETKKRGKNHYITEEHIELAFAWLKGEVTHSDIQRVLCNGKLGAQGYIVIARSLRQAFTEGRITLHDSRAS